MLVGGASGSGEAARAGVPRVELPGAAGESPGAILAALEATGPFSGFLGIQSLERDTSWRDTLVLAEAEPADAAPPGFAWAAAADVAASPALPDAVREALGRWTGALREDPATWAPWYRPGWRRHLADWLDVRLGALGRRVTEPVRVVHTGPVSVVLRAGTEEGPVFVKTGLPCFAREATLLELLARGSPGRVPDVLAADPAVGVAMAPMGGRNLGDDPPEAWDVGLEALAGLQIAWSDRVPELLAAAAADRSLAALAGEVAAMDPVYDALVRLEPDAWPAWPSLRSLLLGRIGELAASPLPATLLHGDLHPGNVQVDVDGVRLFDWSDTAVSHPFIDLAVFLVNAPDPATRRALLDAYLDAWSAGYERAALERAAAHAIAVGAAYQVTTYLTLLPGMDPRERWQYAQAAPRWLRRALRPVDIAPPA